MHLLKWLESSLGPSPFENPHVLGSSGLSSLHQHLDPQVMTIRGSPQLPAAAGVEEDAAEGAETWSRTDTSHRTMCRVRGRKKTNSLLKVKGCPVPRFPVFLGSAVTPASPRTSQHWN